MQYLVNILEAVIVPDDVHGYVHTALKLVSKAMVVANWIGF